MNEKIFTAKARIFTRNDMQLTWCFLVFLVVKHLKLSASLEY